ncbi:hypothetical protein ASF89_12395 [Frigoribacterium sp. Leaf172]|nr:hypothetical protein ASF89_12395 [Frigoribacterium sp. Leaf172]
MVERLLAVTTGVSTPDGSETFTVTVNVAGPSAKSKVFFETELLISVGGLTSAAADALALTARGTMTPTVRTVAIISARMDQVLLFTFSPKYESR